MTGLTIVSPVRSGQVAGWISSRRRRRRCRVALVTGLTRLRFLVQMAGFDDFAARISRFTTLFQIVKIFLLRRGQYLSQKSGIFPVSKS